MARKLLSTDDLTARVNTMLATPDSILRVADYTPEQAFRMGAASVLEQVLHATGTYRGYIHLGSEWDPVRHALREGHDDTRRRYHQP